MMYHYVYRITNLVEKKYYYGVHSCNCAPKEDIGVKYWSSSTIPEFIQDQKDNPQDYKYKIVKLFESRKAAELYEMFIHNKFNVMFNNKFYNKWNANDKWTTHGLTGVTEISSGNRILITSSEYQNNKDKYISHSANKVSAKDLRDNTNKMISKEEFDNNDYYVGASHNMVSAKDLRDNTNKMISKEEFDNNDYYVGVTYNMVSAKDLNTGKYITVCKEEFQNNKNYVGVTNNMFIALDSNGNKHYICNNDPRFLSGEFMHHSKILISITNGEKNKRVKPNEVDKYIDIGWTRGITQFTDKRNHSYETKYMNKDGERKRVKFENIEEYINNGWSLGMPKIICTYCGKSGAGSSMYKYHFDNCKK